MYASRKLIFALSVMFAFQAPGTTLFAQGVEHGGRRTDFSLSSLNGSYAVIGTYGHGVARLIGTANLDGRGNVSGSARVNVPGPNNQRVVIPVSYAGFYSVNPDGTGLLSVKVFLPDNSVQPANIDLVITKAEYIRGEKIGTEMATAQRETSTVLGGEFVTHIVSRRPD